jgi:hypothetical protein
MKRGKMDLIKKYGRLYSVELDARLGIGLVQERIRIVKRHYLGSMMAL